MRPLGFVPVRRTPCHPGAASVGGAFPVSRRPKARVTRKHTEVLSMLWDWGTPLDDFFDDTFNRAIYDGTSEAVARDDYVQEGVCGTGAISAATVPVCAHLGLGVPSYREHP